MVDEIAVPEAAQKVIVEKAQAAMDAAKARDEAMELVMAALGVSPSDGWRWRPDASALVLVEAPGPEEEAD